jgi:hypothetical protein
MAGVFVLLGAGASVDAGLPTTVEMIDRLLEDFREQAESAAPIREPMTQSLYRLLKFIVHGLGLQAAVHDDRGGVDVETMFEAIETLANRNRTSIAPFIASWHPLVAEAERNIAAAEHWDRPERRLSKLLSDAIRSREANIARGFSSSFPTSEMDQFARELLGSGDDVGSAFADLADAVLQSVVRVLQLNRSESVRYLEPLVDLYREQRRLHIATLNYDLTIETLAGLTGVVVDTGMDQWKITRTVGFTGPFRLLKLHGSIDWQSSWGQPAPEDRYLPFEGVERIPGQIPEKPALIFGAGNKLRAGGPYLELLRQFEEALSLADSLLVVGYSFRDAHVNSLLTNWFNKDTSARVVVVDPSVGSYAAFGYIPIEKRTLRQELAWLAQHHPERVQLIPGNADKALAAGIAAARNRPSIERSVETSPSG